MPHPGICSPRGTSQPPGNLKITFLHLHGWHPSRHSRFSRPGLSSRGATTESVPGASPEADTTPVLPTGLEHVGEGSRALGCCVLRVALALQGERGTAQAQQPRLVRADGNAKAQRGQSWGVQQPQDPQVRVTPCKGGTAQTRPHCCLRDAGNTSDQGETIRAAGNSSPRAHTLPCLTPEPRSLGLQSPGILWAQSPWDQPRSCLQCQHGHPTANLPKPTSTGAVPALGQGPKHRHHCQHTPRGWDCAGHPVGAVTSQPRSCTETRHNQHPWPEISEKAPQLMIMAEPFQGVEINSTLHRSCAGRGGEHRASSSRVT